MDLMSIGYRCLLNPYIVVGYNTPLISTVRCKQFEIYGSVPKFTNDWRWQSLHGQNKQFNKEFLKIIFQYLII